MKQYHVTVRLRGEQTSRSHRELLSKPYVEDGFLKIIREGYTTWFNLSDVEEFVVWEEEVDA